MVFVCIKSPISEIFWPGIKLAHSPLPGTLDEADESSPEIAEVRKAQTLVGELLWLAVRSRLDISFAVSWLGRHVTRAHEESNNMECRSWDICRVPGVWVYFMELWLPMLRKWRIGASTCTLMHRLVLQDLVVTKA